jgi:uncharacterized protein with HEPN domain
VPLADEVVRINHIIQAAEQALEFTKGRHRSELDQNVMLGLALVRLLEIIEEAAWRVSEPMRSRYPEVPWRNMTDMRNRLIHGYFDVDLDTVWETVTAQLPPLIPKLQMFLAGEVK